MGQSLNKKKPDVGDVAFGDAVGGLTTGIEFSLYGGAAGGGPAGAVAMGIMGAGFGAAYSSLAAIGEHYLKDYFGI